MEQYVNYLVFCPATTDQILDTVAEEKRDFFYLWLRDNPNNRNMRPEALIFRSAYVSARMGDLKWDDFDVAVEIGLNAFGDGEWYFTGRLKVATRVLKDGNWSEWREQIIHPKCDLDIYQVYALIQADPYGQEWADPSEMSAKQAMFRLKLNDIAATYAKYFKELNAAYTEQLRQLNQEQANSSNTALSS